MNASELLTTLVARGVEFRAHGEKLRFCPVDRLSPIDLENLREHKATILRLLRSEGIVYENPLVLDTRYPGSVDPADYFDPDPTLGGLCSPIPDDRRLRIGDRHQAANPCPLTTCNGCGSTDYRDISIHNSQSARRDCGRCHRFMGWPRWYGRTLCISK